MRILGTTLCALMMMLGVPNAQTLLTASGTIEFDEIDRPKQMSAIDRVHDLLLIGVDEALGDGREARNVVQLFSEAGPDRFVRQDDIVLCRGSCSANGRREMDIEAIAVDGATVYVAGSHSIARRRVGDGRKYKNNRKRITAGRVAESNNAKHLWKPAAGRDRLVKLTVTEDGKVTELQEASLTEIIAGLKTLAPFQALPSKENGIDIEALAVRDGNLYVGFRGPVLRGGYAPVLKAGFDRIAKGPSRFDTGDLLFVDLGGLGMRSMATVDDGFLIIAGPVGDAPGPYQIVHWDGRDTIPGTGGPGGAATVLGTLPAGDGRPEGLVVLAETARTYEIAIVEDGAQHARAQRYSVSK